MILLLLFVISMHAQTIRTVCASGCAYTLSQVQNAIDDAVCGDIVEITGTSTNSSGSPTMLRYKADCAANGPDIEIRTSKIYNLTPGARVTPADASNLAKLTITSGGPWAVISNEKGASHYRFRGIEITAAAGFTGDLVEFGTRSPTVSYVADHEVADLAHHITFDQCYIHGDAASTDGPRRGIRANLAHVEVINSWIDNFKNQNGESNSIGGWNAKGPGYFKNNHLEAAAITTLFGGAEPNIKGVRADGLFFIGNHYYRRWAWRVRQNSGNPSGTCLYDSNGGEYYKNTDDNSYWRCVGGTWTSISAGEFSAYYWQKNVFELKNATRTWVYGNIFENSWNPAAQNQFGALFLFNLVDNDPDNGPAEPAATVGYVNVHHNYGRRAPWVVSHGSIGTPYYRWHNNINIENNVFDQIGDAPFTLPAAETNGTKWGGGFMTFPPLGDRIAFNFNTMISRNPVEARAGYLYGTAAGNQTAGASIAGNIVSWNKYGFYNDNGAGALWNSVWDGFQPGWIVTRNVIPNNGGYTIYSRPSPIINLGINLDSASDINAAACTASTNELNGSGTLYNGRCAFPADHSAVGFSNFAGGTLAGLKLSSSPYERWSSMGRNPGAHIDEVGFYILGVDTDAAVPSPYLNFEIKHIVKETTKLHFRYSSPASGACTITASTKLDYSSPTINEMSDSGSIETYRAVELSGLSANTRYYWRVTCGSYTKEGIDTTNP